MIYAENAIVRPKDDCHCDYTGQCPRCGHVEIGWTINQHIGKAGYMSSLSVGRKTCSKCKTQYEIKLFNRN